MTSPDPPAPATQLDVLADALGDPTRRAIFVHIAETPVPLTALDVGETFGVHRTVARAHLERLVEFGLLEADFRHRSEGGRPPKVYFRSRQRLSLELPARQYEVLSELLLGTLEQFGPAADLLVETAGLAYGRRLAETVCGEGPEASLEPLRRLGSKLEVTEDDDGLHVNVAACLFRELSQRNPSLVCALDRAIITGLLSRGDERYTLTQALRRDESLDVCRLTFVADHLLGGGDTTPAPGCQQETE
jgi:predicted ArsR family transcriptional regulator